MHNVSGQFKMDIKGDSQVAIDTQNGISWQEKQQKKGKIRNVIFRF